MAYAVKTQISSREYHPTGLASISQITVVQRAAIAIRRPAECGQKRKFGDSLSRLFPSLLST